MIKVSQWSLQGNGSMDFVDKLINEKEISTITYCKERPYYDTHKIVMRNGESFYATITRSVLERL
jgi:hypothetical protein